MRYKMQLDNTVNKNIFILKKSDGMQMSQAELGEGSWEWLSCISQPSTPDSVIYT